MQVDHDKPRTHVSYYLFIAYVRLYLGLHMRLSMQNVCDVILLLSYQLVPESMAGHTCKLEVYRFQEVSCRIVSFLSMHTTKALALVAMGVLLPKRLVAQRGENDALKSSKSEDLD